MMPDKEVQFLLNSCSIFSQDCSLQACPGDGKDITTPRRDMSETSLGSIFSLSTSMLGNSLATMSSVVKVILL